MKKKLKEITVHYQKIHKSGLNLRVFDCQKLSDKSFFNNFKDEISQISMFKEKKLAIIINSFSNASFKNNFLKEKEKFLKSNDIILFYEQGEINKKDELFKILKENAKCQEFKPLLGRKLINWTKKEIEKEGAKIDQKALEKLCEYIGNDLWRMANEIKKLISFCQKREIKVKDVEILVKPKIETDIFKTIDAISQKNKKYALELLHKHLKEGDSPLYLLAMINYQFKNILIVKDLIEKHQPYNLILKKSGLHPFVAKKSYFQSQQFSFSELKKIYRYIFQVDFNIKTGQINPELALDLLISKI